MLCLCRPQLFICQYHIWLAADTKGILVLIPGNPSLNILVSTFIFVCVAHEVSLVTNDLAQVVIPKDSMALLRRLGAAGVFTLVVLLSHVFTPRTWRITYDERTELWSRGLSWVKLLIKTGQTLELFCSSPPFSPPCSWWLPEETCRSTQSCCFCKIKLGKRNI